MPGGQRLLLTLLGEPPRAGELRVLVWIVGPRHRVSMRAIKPGLGAAEALAADIGTALKSDDRAAAAAKLAALKASCTACHRKHRDGG